MQCVCCTPLRMEVTTIYWGHCHTYVLIYTQSSICYTHHPSTALSSINALLWPDANYITFSTKPVMYLNAQQSTRTQYHQNFHKAICAHCNATTDDPKWDIHQNMYDMIKTYGSEPRGQEGTKRMPNQKTWPLLWVIYMTERFKNITSYFKIRMAKSQTQESTHPSYHRQ